MRQHLVHDAEVDAFLHRERARLGDREHLRRVHELVAELHDLAEAGAARVHDERPTRFERGPGRVEHRGVAADHDGERAVLGADRAARQRRVEVARAGRRDALVLFAFDRGIDRRRVDDDLARPERGERGVDHLDDVG